MNTLSFTIKLIKRILTVLIVAATAGTLSALILAPPARAGSPIFVRPGGDDLFCSGTANVDYNSVVAPACAVKTVQRAMALAGPNNDVVLDTGTGLVTIPTATGISAVAATLVVDKADSPDPVDFQIPLTYTIHVTNTSTTDNANNVELFDILPQVEVVSYKSVTSSQGVCSLLPSNVITCTLGTLITNTNAVVTIVVTPTAAGNIFNSVSVRGGGGIGGADDEFTVVEGDTDLSISKIDFPDPVVVGTPLTYTLVVSNSGLAPAVSAILTDTLPSSVVLGPIPSGCTYGAPTLTCTLGFLGVNSSTTISLVVTPTVTGIITNTAGITVTPGATDPDLSNNLATQTTRVVSPTTLTVIKDDGVICAAPNQTITYTITYSNSGGAPVNNVFLTDFKPPTYTNFLPGNGWIDAGGGVYTRALGTVSPGGPQGPVYFQVQLVDRPAIPSTVTAITNVIQISGGHTFTEVTAVPLSPDLVIAKNDNIGVTAISAEFVRLYQQVTGQTPSLNAQATSVAVGDFIEYTVVFANNGRGTATNVVLTDTLPLYTTYAGGPDWTNVSGQLYRHVVGNLDPGQGGFLTFRVQVANSLPAGVEWIINRVDIGGAESECNITNSFSYEQTPVTSTQSTTTTIYLPIILKQPPLPPDDDDDDDGDNEPPAPLAYVSDVKADADTNQVYIASPRHDWVYVINGGTDTLARNVPVGHGPTGLAVLKGSVPANNKVFVAHQYGANFWRPGFMAFGVSDTSAHSTFDNGYAGAAPVKTAANSAINRAYVSNYFDKLAVYEGGSETRLNWVVQKGFQGAYGIDASAATQRIYLATRDTGELVVFDGNNDRLLQSTYIPTHVKPPLACSLFSVVVNETTGHVFVPCPQLGRVFVLQESQVSVLDLEAMGVLEERDGNKAMVVSAQAAPWIADITVPVGTGEEGIAAVNSSTGRVFITNAQNNTLVVLQDGPTPAYVTTVGVGTRPQGVDVNPATQKVYVGNTGSNTVTVLNANSPFGVITTIPLAP